MATEQGIEPYRIGLTAASLTGNKGAAAMAAAVVDGLGRRLPAGTRFLLFSPYPRRDRETNTRGNLTIVPSPPVHAVLLLPAVSAVFHVLRRLHLPTAPLVRLYRPLGAMLSCDAVLDLSGISFVHGRTPALAYNVACLLPPLLLGKPVMKLSQAFGPLGGGLCRKAAKTLLPRLAMVFARGGVSSAHLSDAGIPCTAVAPDLAFTLESPHVESRQGHGIRIALVPSEVMRRRCAGLGIDYPGQLASFCSEAFAEFDAEIVLIAHSNLGPEKRSHNNDWHVCREIEDRIEPGCRVRSVLEESGPEELRRVIAGCTIAVSSRFHGMVSALACGVPVAATSWSHKYAEVMSQFGMEDFVLEARDTSGARLLDLCRRLLADRSVFAERIGLAGAGVREAAGDQLDRVAAFLKDPPVSHKRFLRAIPARFLPDGCTPAVRIGFSLEEATSGRRASGGLVTAMLEDRIATGASKGAVVAGCRLEQGRLDLSTQLARSAEDLRTCSGSIYAWFPHLAHAMEILRRCDGPIDVVGLPCQIAALRKVADAGAIPVRNIGLLVSLWCGHATDRSIAESMIGRWARKSGASPVSFRFRTGRWRGWSELLLSDGGEVRIPFAKGFGLMQNLHAGCRTACLSCRDHLGKHSDISFGDAWIPEEKYSGRKKTVALALSPAGLGALEGLHGSRRIVSRSAGQDLVMAAQARSLAWHDRGPTRAALSGIFGYRLPGEWRLSLIHAPAALAELSLVRLFDSPLGGLLLGCPWWMKMPFLIVLKALQTIAGARP